MELELACGLVVVLVVALVVLDTGEVGRDLKAEVIALTYFSLSDKTTSALLCAKGEAAVAVLAGAVFVVPTEAPLRL